MNYFRNSLRVLSFYVLYQIALSLNEPLIFITSYIVYSWWISRSKNKLKYFLGTSKAGNVPKKPTTAYEDPAGLDIYCPDNFELLEHNSGGYNKIELAIHFEIPEGYWGLLLPRSSLSKKNLLMQPGVIDSDFRGSVFISVMNLGNTPVKFSTEIDGAIAQIIIIKKAKINIIQAQKLEDLSKTERGEKGHGSSTK